MIIPSPLVLLSINGAGLKGKLLSGTTSALQIKIMIITIIIGVIIITIIIIIIIIIVIIITVMIMKWSSPEYISHWSTQVRLCYSHGLIKMMT